MMESVVKNLVKAQQVLKKLDQPVTYVGGAVIPLYIEDSAAEQPRPTLDVDTVVKTTTYGEYVTLQDELRSIGMKESTDPDDPPCRFLYEGLKIDVMPVKGQFYGFTNEWYEEGVEHAIEKEITEDVSIRVFTPVYLLADKINTFRDRGGKDYYASQDFEDIVRLFDGFPDLISEVKDASSGVKTYIHEWIEEFLKTSNATDCVAAHVSQKDRAKILLDRMKQAID